MSHSFQSLNFHFFFLIIQRKLTNNLVNRNRNCNYIFTNIRIERRLFIQGGIEVLEYMSNLFIRTYLYVFQLSKLYSLLKETKLQMSGISGPIKI